MSSETVHIRYLNFKHLHRQLQDISATSMNKRALRMDARGQLTQGDLLTRVSICQEGADGQQHLGNG